LKIARDKKFAIKHNVLLHISGASAVVTPEYISSPRIRDFIPIKDKLSLVMLKPKKVEHTTIRQTGNAILEISKQIFKDFMKS